MFSLQIYIYHLPDRSFESATILQVHYPQDETFRILPDGEYALRVFAFNSQQKQAADSATFSLFVVGPGAQNLLEYPFIYIIVPGIVFLVIIIVVTVVIFKKVHENRRRTVTYCKGMSCCACTCVPLLLCMIIHMRMFVSHITVSGTHAHTYTRTCIHTQRLVHTHTHTQKSLTQKVTPMRSPSKSAAPPAPLPHQVSSAPLSLSLRPPLPVGPSLSPLPVGQAPPDSHHHHNSNNNRDNSSWSKSHPLSVTIWLQPFPLPRNSLTRGPSPSCLSRQSPVLSPYTAQ